MLYSFTEPPKSQLSNEPEHLIFTPKNTDAVLKVWRPRRKVLEPLRLGGRTGFPLGMFRDDNKRLNFPEPVNNWSRMLKDVFIAPKH